MKTIFVQNLKCRQQFHGTMIYILTPVHLIILTILLLSCKEYPTLLKKLNSSPAEKALKSGLTLMLQGNVNLGKTTILDYMRSLLGLQK